MSFDEINKIAAAVLSIFLVFLLLNFASGKIYGTGGEHGGEHELAYAIELEESESAADAEPEEVDLVQLALAADADAGAKVFGKCKACHKLDEGANGVGPSLWGVYDRDIGSVDGFAYSATLAELPGNWDLAALSGFLENPKAYAPGTKMSYAGLKDPVDRVNLIAYLNEADGSPADLGAGADRTEAPATTEMAAAPAAEEAPSPQAPAAEVAAAPAAEAPAPEAPAAEAPAAEAPAAEAPAAEAPAAEAPAAEAPAETAAAPATAEETVVAAAPAPAESGVSALFASADADAGAKVFRKCRACHKVEEGKNGVGPSLWGVVGRDIGSVDGFSYSDALASVDGDWSATNLLGFLENPREWAPGTKMSYSGLKDEEDRVNLIQYLNEADGSPEPLN